MSRMSRMSRVSGLTFAAVLCLSLCVASPAIAGPKEDKAYAAALKKAQAAQDKGEHEKALELLTKAREAKATPDLGYYEAVSLLALGKATEAFDAVTAVRPQLAGDLSGAAADLTAKAADAIGPIEVTIKSPVEADVMVDGKAAGKAPGKVEVKAGEHKFEVGRAGYTKFQTTQFVAPGKANTVDANLSATTGSLLLETDSDGIVAVVDGAKNPLTKGTPVTLTRKGGDVVVDFFEGDQKVYSVTATVVAGQSVTAAYTAYGKLAVPAPKGRTLSLKLGDKKYTVNEGDAPLPVAAGEYDLVIKSEGMVPTTGKIKVERGKTTTVTPVVEDVPDVSTQETLGWVSFGTGFALILTTIIVDQTVDFDDTSTRDAVEWTTAGLGGALTITGGVLLKDAFDRHNNPDTNTVDYGVSYTAGVAPTDGGAVISGGFTF